MAEVCCDENMSITSGVLGISKYSVPRFVVDSTVNSTGDGTLTQQTTLPGKLMIDASVSWTSDSPLPCTILARITRGTRNLVTSNPNYVQFRDRYTYTFDGSTPRVPDTSNTYQAAWGSSVDRGTNTSGVPWAGVYYDYADPSLTEDFLGPLAPGATFKLRYQCYVWTPPPWSNNANNNTPTHSAAANNVRIQLIAFPTQDTRVVIG